MNEPTDSNAAADKTPEQLLQLLRDQLGLCRALESIANRQRALITKHDAASLLSVLEDRRHVSARLEELSRSLEPVRAQWAMHRDRLNDEQRKEARRLLADIQTRIGRVMREDEQDAKLLALQKHGTVHALRTVQSRRSALSMYQQPFAKEKARFDQEAS